MKKINVRKQQSKRETKVYGLNACRAFFNHNPEGLIKAYFTNRTKRGFSDVMKFCVEQKKAYHVRPKDEFEKICQSNHHEEVCFLIETPKHVTLKEYIKNNTRRRFDTILAVDGISNPHNLGSLMRICANFGVLNMLTCDPDALRNASVMRTAEGGAEAVQVLACRNLSTAFADLKKVGYRICSSSSHNGKNLPDFHWPSKTVLVLGAESVGVSEMTGKLADRTLKIQGTGAVESLNVACAASVLLYDRQTKNG